MPAEPIIRLYRDCESRVLKARRVHTSDIPLDEPQHSRFVYQDVAWVKVHVAQDERMRRIELG